MNFDGRVLRKLREDAGLDLRAVAAEAGVASHSTVRHAEANELRPQTAIRYLEAMDRLLRRQVAEARKELVRVERLERSIGLQIRRHLDRLDSTD